MPGNHNKKEIKTDIRNFETKIELKSFFGWKTKINLTKTIVSLQIFLISNLNQLGDPKSRHIIKTFIEALNSDAD